MLKFKSVILLFTVLVACALSSYAPMPLKNEERILQEQKKKLEKEIQFTKEKIKEIKGQKESVLVELTTIRAQVNARRKLIQNINAQVRLLNKKIDQADEIMASLEEDMEELKTSYGKMLRHAYMNHQTDDKILYLLASKDLNEIYKKVKYLKEYSKYRNRQSTLIKSTLKSIETEKVELIERQKRKKSLLSEQTNERKLLETGVFQLNTKVKTFKQRESYYHGQIQKKNKQLAQLDKKIKEIIRAAMKPKTKSGKGKGKDGYFKKSPEVILQSKQFAANKGRLPWPVSEGIITGRFGKRYDPELKISFINNGVDFSTKKLADVRAIFEGEVIEILKMAIYKNTVILKHGDYFTVYRGLESTEVNVGDKVSTKQTLGKVVYDEKLNKAETHLQIWKIAANPIKLNPEHWLAK